MNIKITRNGPKSFTADCTDLPGAALVGVGRTKVMALAALLFKLTAQKGTLTVNGKPWQDIEGASQR